MVDILVWVWAVKNGSNDEGIKANAILNFPSLEIYWKLDNENFYFWLRLSGEEPFKCGIFLPTFPTSNESVKQQKRNEKSIFS